MNKKIQLPNLGCDYKTSYVEDGKLIVEYTVRPGMHGQALKPIDIFVPDDAPENIVYRRVKSEFAHTEFGHAKPFMPRIRAPTEAEKELCERIIDNMGKKGSAKGAENPHKNLEYHCEQTGLEGADFHNISSTESWDPSAPERKGIEEGCVGYFFKYHGNKFGSNYSEIRATVFAHLNTHPECKKAYEAADRDQKQGGKEMMAELKRKLSPEERAELDRDIDRFEKKHPELKKAFIEALRKARGGQK